MLLIIFSSAKRQEKNFELRYAEIAFPGVCELHELNCSTKSNAKFKVVFHQIIVQMMRITENECVHIIPTNLQHEKTIAV